MRVAITGGTGMIGTALAQALRERGDDVRILTRRRPRGPDEVRWDPEKGTLDAAKLQGVDAVVHLAGAPIADRPWTRARRRVLWDSRVESGRLLLNTLGKLPDPPRIVLGSGGLGRFGHRGEQVLEDDAEAGTGFLAELSVAWEDALLKGGAAMGARSAVLRMSIVLSPTGGVFPLMVKPFRLGLGGWLGDGLQFTPWITIRDTTAAFLHLLDDANAEGGFNATVPDPTRHYDWSKALGRVLHRPVVTHAPKWALRGALGDLADELLIASVRAVPTKLLASGFTFVDTDAEAAFQWLVAEPRS